MRLTALAALMVTVLLSTSGSSLAQGAEFVSKEDLFAAKFPGDPVVTSIPWETDQGASLTGRAYTVKQGRSTYSITAVDYNPVQAILTAASKECEKGLERCDGLTAFSGPGYWKNDVRGALIYVAFKLMKRDAKVTQFKWNYLPQGVEEYELQLLNNADKSRTFASIFMHHNRLYIVDATLPGNSQAPDAFLESIVLLEEDGKSASHQHVLFNATEVEPNEAAFSFRYSNLREPPQDDAEWHLYNYKEDRFGISFPSEPVITPIVWTTEYGADLQARVYTAKKGPSTYTVTMVDYNPVKGILTAKSKQCKPGPDPCNRWTAFSGPGYWKNDVRGAMVYVIARLLKRDVKVTNYMWNYLGAVGLEVNELQLINNADQSRTYVSIYMTENRLYITEGTVPGNYPPPTLFQQALWLYDADGMELTHGYLYFNGAKVDPEETATGEKGPAAPVVSQPRMYFTAAPR